MKRCLLCLPLLGLAPLGTFLGEYLSGAGALPEGIGFLASAASMFILPWIVAALFLARPKTKAAIRVLLFIGALVVQGVLLFAIVPAGSTSEMMGIAHRLRREFSVDELRDCANHLRHKFRDGTLGVSTREKDDDFTVGQSAVVVLDDELPDSLRGRFLRVFIQKPPATGDEQVVFALDKIRGIICDSRKHVHEFFVYSMADGVQAYRYQRL